MCGADREGLGTEEVGDATGAFNCGSLRYGCASGRDDRVVGGIFLYYSAVGEGDFAAWDGGDAVAWDEDAGKVEGVGCGHGDGRFRGARGVLGAGFAEGFD